MREWLLVLLYGLLTSSASFSCVSAIPLMPIGDLIVVCMSTPVFSVILDKLVLKRPLTLLSVTLCVSIVFGDILVVHPELLTGSGTSGEAGEAEARLPGDDLQRRGAAYLAGVALCLYTAAAVSVSNVVQISVTQPAPSAWTKNHLMVVAGVWSVLLSAAAAATQLSPNRLLSWPAAASLAPLTGALLAASAALTLAALWATASAVALLQHATLVTMLRSTEICISLVTEAVYWGHLPHPLSAVGSILVMLSIVMMSAHDIIILSIESLKKRLRQALFSTEKKKSLEWV